MADEYDDLYGDLYPGEAEYGAQATSTAASATPAPAQAAAAPAASTSLPSAPSSLPAAPAAQPATSAIPSYSESPAPPSGQGLQSANNASNPPPIHFAPNYAAQRATDGRTAGVRPGDMPEEGKMFIGGLNWDTTDDTLKAYFEQFGRITNCMIMRDMETGRSRGFGFLTFEDVSSVNAVMAREHHLDGKTIDPKRAIPRSDTAKTDKLFVRALPQSCTQESFRAYWRQFGSITDATLMMDKDTGRHRGFGFVNYERREDVEKVLQAGPHYMDGQMLEVKRAQAKGEPRRQDYGVNTNQHYTPQPNLGGGVAGGAMGGAMPMGGAPGMGGMGGMGAPGMGMGGMGGMGMGAGMGGMGGAGASPFDPAAMAKFFSSMGWGAWNPQMMMGGMGGGMGGGMMGGQGAFNPMMGMGGMGMGGGMGGMGGGQFGGSPMGAIGSPGGDGAGADGGEGAAPQGGSGFAAPMAAPMGGMRGGRGGAMGGPGGRGGAMGGRGGGRAGFNPPTGPAAMRDDGGAGPQRNRGGGAGFHPYSR